MKNYLSVLVLLISFFTISVSHGSGENEPENTQSTFRISNMEDQEYEENPSEEQSFIPDSLNHPPVDGS